MSKMDESFPYETDGHRTHYAGCYRTKGHHNCAVAEVDRLKRELAGMEKVMEAAESVAVQTLIDEDGLFDGFDCEISHACMEVKRAFDAYTASREGK